MSAGNSAPTLQYQSFFEPAPIPNESVYGVMWGNGRFPDRTDYRRRRPVNEGLFATDPTTPVPVETIEADKWTGNFPARLYPRKRPLDTGMFATEPYEPIDDVTTGRYWSTTHPDYINRRRRASWEGLYATEAYEPIDDVATGKYWGAVAPDYLPRRKRAMWDGLSVVQPQTAVDLVATQYDWRAVHPDAVARRKRAVDTGHFAFDAQPAIDEVVTGYRWRTTHPDYLPRRKRATWEGIEAFDPQTAVNLVITEHDWHAHHPDRIARRQSRLPIQETLQDWANFAGLEEITLDKWAGRYPDRLNPRRRPVGEGGAEAEDLTARFDVGLYRWTPTFPDRPLRRPTRPPFWVTPELFANFDSGEIVTLDKWAGRFPDRLNPRRRPLNAIWLVEALSAISGIPAIQIAASLYGTKAVAVSLTGTSSLAGSLYGTTDVAAGLFGTDTVTQNLYGAATISVTLERS